MEDAQVLRGETFQRALTFHRFEAFTRPDGLYETYMELLAASVMGRSQQGTVGPSLQIVSASSPESKFKRASRELVVSGGIP